MEKRKDRAPHAWSVTPAEAIQIQKELREKVSLVPFGKEPKYIAGADVSMNLFSTSGFAGFIVLKFPELTVVDHSVVNEELKFPYIPGLLSFREIPSLLNAWKKLKIKPDIVVVDGIGIAHPRRLGIATHLGILLDVPTIGCAKSVLTGNYEEPGMEAGSRSYLYDRFNKDEILGVALRTKNNVKPVFISPGNKITVDEAADLVAQCVKKHRLPEPTRLAHNIVNEFRLKALGKK